METTLYLKDHNIRTAYSKEPTVLLLPLQQRCSQLIECRAKVAGGGAWEMLTRTERVGKGMHKLTWLRGKESLSSCLQYRCHCWIHPAAAVTASCSPTSPQPIHNILGIRLQGFPGGGGGSTIPLSLLVPPSLLSPRYLLSIALPYLAAMARQGHLMAATAKAKTPGKGGIPALPYRQCLWQKAHWLQPSYATALQGSRA